MTRVPDCCPDSEVAEIRRWIGYERDAGWTARLAVLRLEQRDDIARLGSHVCEHDRHAEELGQLLQAADPRWPVAREPPFLTGEAHVIGALARPDAVLDALAAIEGERVARYERERSRGKDGLRRLLDALLERHELDACKRLAWLTARRRGRLVVRGAAA